ncbi:hypothetical protein RYA05_03895 [Pseudomonas syringae pv. actinidiae]|nr:hypothetical protein [Pseudomonas syringae pv. actinidiae]
MDSLIMLAQYVIAMIAGGFQYDTKATVMILSGVVVLALVLTYAVGRLIFSRKRSA